MLADTGKKIGSILGNVLDVMVIEVGGNEGRHIKVLVEIDLTKPLARGTKLRYKNNEIWVQFKYEQLPGFCFCCGCIGHSDRVCIMRKEDMKSNRLKGNEFGSWLRAFSVKMSGDRKQESSLGGGIIEGLW